MNDFWYRGDKAVSDAKRIDIIGKRMFGHSLLWVPQSQMAWHDKQERAQPTSSPGLWDGH